MHDQQLHNDNGIPFYRALDQENIENVSPKTKLN